MRYAIKILVVICLCISFANNSHCEVQLNGTEINIQKEKETIINNDWYCGLENHPNTITDNLVRLYRFTLARMAVDNDGNIIFQDKNDGIYAQGIYYSTHIMTEAYKKNIARNIFKTNTPENIKILAQTISSIPVNRKNLNMFFSKLAEGRLSLSPGRFEVSSCGTYGEHGECIGDHRKNIVYTGCYTEKDLLAIAKYQKSASARFLKAYNKKAKRLKEMFDIEAHRR